MAAATPSQRARESRSPRNSIANTSVTVEDNDDSHISITRLLPTGAATAGLADETLAAIGELTRARGGMPP